MSDSRISGFYRLPINERLQLLVERGFLDPQKAESLRDGNPLLPMTHADRMIENVVGVFGLPFAIAPNFLVNGRDHIVPMVVEEPSIVAGVSAAAKLFRDHGGFTATQQESLLIGQVQVSNVGDSAECLQKLQAQKVSLIEFSNDLQPRLVARGGGVRDIEFHTHELANGESTVVLHLLVDTCDAMGANLVNTICEAVASQVVKISGAEVGLRILSNLADRSLLTARGKVSLSAFGTDDEKAAAIRDGIVSANSLARVDAHRAATHNKGIMNGIDALAIATGNDWRAIEAGAHAFAARSGAYQALTDWSVDDQGDLVGSLTLPLKPGIVGGSQQLNPGAEVGLAVCGVSSAQELAELMGATGLAQNFAALKALASEGIQRGHMALHARGVAASAGVPDALFDEVVAAMIEAGEVKIWKAKQLVADRSSQSHRTVVHTPPNAASGEAAGKVILLGEHAVVHNRHALAVPIDNAVNATIGPGSSGIRLSIPDWQITQSWSGSENVLEGAAAVVELIVQSLGLVDRAFDVDVRSRVPLGMGLGSSASFAVAVIRAFDHLHAIGMSDAEVNQLALKCESITHGTPSGIDNHVATFARPILFHRSTGGIAIDLDTTEGLPLVIAASGHRGNTKTMVGEVGNRFARHRVLYSAIFDQIDELSTAGAEALRKSDFGQLGVLMNVCHGLLNALEVSSPELEKMINMARCAGAIGAKLTGAGGGGSIVALCPGKVAEVTRTLAGAGYRIVPMSE